SRPAATGRGAVAPRRPARSSDDLDRAPGQARDEAKAEGDVRPALVAAVLLLERIAGPDEWARALRNGHPLVRMPHAVAATILEEPLEQLGPVLVALEEAHTSHQLQPMERGGHVRVSRVAMRQRIAEHEVRNGNGLTAAQLDQLLSRLCLRDVRIERIHLAMV